MKWETGKQNTDWGSIYLLSAEKKTGLWPNKKSSLNRQYNDIKPNPNDHAETDHAL